MVGIVFREPALHIAHHDDLASLIALPAGDVRPLRPRPRPEDTHESGLWV